MRAAREATETSLEARLTQTGRRIDGVVARARLANEGTGPVVRRLDSLRAREAQTWTRLRELRAGDGAGWPTGVGALAREVDRLGNEVAIVSARFEADLAVNPVEFDAAATHELDAWSVHIDALEAGSAPWRRGTGSKQQAAILQARVCWAAAQRQLNALRQGGDDPLVLARLEADVRRAMDDLDQAGDEAAASVCAGTSGTEAPAADLPVGRRRPEPDSIEQENAT